MARTLGKSRVTRLQLTIGQHQFDVEVLLPRTSPTFVRLCDICPWQAELHYAKVAGEEVMIPVPFLLPIENPAQVANIEPGSLCYWPDRSLLCCYYGTTSEAETVTVIGKITGDLHRLREAGHNVRVRPGAIARLALQNQ